MSSKLPTLGSTALFIVAIVGFICPAEAKWKAPQPFEQIKSRSKLSSKKQNRPLVASKAKSSHKTKSAKIPSAAKSCRLAGTAKTLAKAARPEPLRVQPLPTKNLSLAADRHLISEMPEEILSAELAEDTTALEDAAYQLFGTKYRFGGSSLNGIDCSGFVRKVYQLLNVNLPRTAREQFAVGQEISQNEIQKGDLVFFQTYANYPSHVGIYLGDNRMIHASSGSHRVTISSMDTPYYRSRYLGARRLQGENGAAPLLLANLE